MLVIHFNHVGDPCVPVEPTLDSCWLLFRLPVSLFLPYLVPIVPSGLSPLHPPQTIQMLA